MLNLFDFILVFEINWNLNFFSKIYGDSPPRKKKLRIFFNSAQQKVLLYISLHYELWMKEIR